MESNRSKLKLHDIEITHKQKRLDGGVDHLIKAIMKDDSVFYISVRSHDEKATTCYWKASEEKSNMLTWVTVDKKRTLKATCRLLLEKHSEAFNTKNNTFDDINRDDRDARKAARLSKRNWRVHDVAFFDDGYFVARLSCSKLEKDEVIDNQFILYPSAFEELTRHTHLTQWSLFSKHGSFSSAVKVNVHALFQALRSDRYWHRLSTHLNQLEYGYSTEREARAGYEYILQNYKTKPVETQKFNCRNSVRQQSIDKTVSAIVCDEYDNYKEKAWLLKSGVNYYIAKMYSSVPGKIELKGHNISTAFTTIENSAIELISQHNKNGERTVSSDDIKIKWKAMIEEDLRQRLFVRNLDALWLITDIATLNGTCRAIKATCLPELSLSLPVEFQAHSYHIIYVDDVSHKIIDASDKERSLYMMKQKPDTFIQLLQVILDSPITLDSKIYTDIVDSLRYSRGFFSENEAENVWANINPQWISNQINGGVCPITLPQRKSGLDHLLNVKRNTIIERMSNDTENDLRLEKYDHYILESKIYPPELIELGLQKGLCSINESTHIKKTNKKYRYDLTVDLFKSDAEVVNVTENSIKNQSDECKSRDALIEDKIITDAISTIKKSNAGRKKIHKSERERKRLWAKKNREEKRQQLSDQGIAPKKRGPDKKYSSPAEKQAAYRFRNKWLKASENSAIIYIEHQEECITDDIENNINDIIQLLHESTQELKILSLIPVVNHAKTSRKKNSKISKITPNNVYKISSLEDYIKIKDRLKEWPVNRVLLCGSSITDHCYRLATYLHEVGYEPYFIKHCLHSNDAWEVDTGLSLFRKKFGAKNII